jgi:tRNA A-37 threonylcarbamoyl transferase component Bud32
VVGNQTPQIGDVIAEKYRLEKVAGEGGMGVVYAAEHLVLKQRVAVKILLPGAATSAAAVERFSREARAAAKINSEHVARVLDAGETAGGAPFLVMEYLEGCDLEELLALQKALPFPEAVDYAVQALEGLAHAHAAGIVHRDIKPANLYLGCRPDGSNAIKLLDFGISKTERRKPGDKRLTGQHVLGSPVYMSPEQLRNSDDIDGRADLWSIGIVLYEMISGDPPFDGEGVGEIFAAILEQEAVPLSRRCPNVPAELSELVAQCLQRDPKARWQDAGQLARALAPFGSDLQGATVERAEHVLQRAKQMRAMRTPMETRRVVEAIEAARQAMAGAARKSEPALILTRRKDVALTQADGVSTKIGHYARRSPLRAVVTGLGVAAVVGACAFGALRMTRASAAAARTPALSELPGTRAATPPPPVVPEESAKPHVAAPPVVSGQAPSASGEKAPPTARGSKSKGGKTQRPKFLNSRE